MRNRFDQFAKLVTRKGLAPGGAVETDAEVSPDAKRIDVWFTPNPRLPASTLDHLGLLGRIARAACTIEPFHQPPDGDEAMACLCKHHLFRRLLAQREPPPPLPTQWILSSGRPSSALAGLGFQPSRRWGPGIYEGLALTHTNLIVIRELPATRDTLLVRLMGAGPVLRKAIAELDALPEDAPERVLALPLLLRLRLEMPADPRQRTQEDEEFLMSTQDIAEKYIAELRMQGLQQGLLQGLQQGRQQGLEQGQQALAEALLSIYKLRFGQLPRGIVAAIQGTHDLSVLRGWLDLITTRPANEIAATLRASRSSRTSPRRAPSKKG